MGVDVADVGRRDAGLRAGFGHRADRCATMRIWLREVVQVRRRGVTSHFTQRSTATHGFGFSNHHARAFSQRQAITRGIEWPWDATGCQRMQCIKTRKHQI